jgi:hypothetical protein
LLLETVKKKRNTHGIPDLSSRVIPIEQTNRKTNHSTARLTAANILSGGHPLKITIGRA